MNILPAIGVEQFLLPVLLIASAVLQTLVAVALWNYYRRLTVTDKTDQTRKEIL
jgi:hypothetical protein